MYGALIFLGFQLLTRVPAMQVIQLMLAPRLQASRAWLLGWLVVTSLSAGVVEEGGRYIGYRWLLRRHGYTWRNAVMFGLGHGGLESALFVAGLTLLGLINLLVLPSLSLEALEPAQRAAVEQQLAAVAAQPDWLPLMGAWERFWTIWVHVALSVMVLQVFVCNRLGWLWLAILVHGAVNFVVAVLARCCACPEPLRCLPARC